MHQLLLIASCPFTCHLLFIYLGTLMRSPLSHWACSRSSISVLYCGAQNCTQSTVASPGLSSRLLIQILKMQPSLLYYFFSKPRSEIQILYKLWFSYGYELVLCLQSLNTLLRSSKPRWSGTNHVANVFHSSQEYRSSCLYLKTKHIKWFLSGVQIPKNILYH